MAIVAEHSIGRVWQEEGERNGDAFRLLNGTDPALQIPLLTSDSSPSALMCPRCNLLLVILSATVPPHPVNFRRFPDMFYSFEFCLK
uniref:Uncharacterized protein n=1 Tax=Heterorhabditis bacteriophora TaxID=37862 RepID=A0A1I7WTC1_HETBA